VTARDQCPHVTPGPSPSCRTTHTLAPSKGACARWGQQAVHCRQPDPPQDPATPISTVPSSAAAASESRDTHTPPPPSGRWGDAASPCSPLAHTQAAAALAIGLQHPALVAGALDVVLVLLALLAALEVLGTVALDLAGLVV